MTLTKKYYQEYLPWCDTNWYSPFSYSVFYKYKQAIYQKHHENISTSEFKREDRRYMEELTIHHTERKWFLNQYMVLWWKLYLKKKYAIN